MLDMNRPKLARPEQYEDKVKRKAVAIHLAGTLAVPGRMLLFGR